MKKILFFSLVIFIIAFSQYSVAKFEQTFTLHGLDIHKITEEETTESTVTFKIDSQVVTLPIGETLLDITGDGLDDINITILSIINGVPNIVLRSVQNPIPKYKSIEQITKPKCTRWIPLYYSIIRTIPGVSKKKPAEQTISIYNPYLDCFILQSYISCLVPEGISISSFEKISGNQYVSPLFVINDSSIYNFSFSIDDSSGSFGDKRIDCHLNYVRYYPEIVGGKEVNVYVTKEDIGQGWTIKGTVIESDYNSENLDINVPFVKDMNEPQCPEGNNECSVSEVVESPKELARKADESAQNAKLRRIFWISLIVIGIPLFLLGIYLFLLRLKGREEQQANEISNLKKEVEELKKK